MHIISKSSSIIYNCINALKKNLIIHDYYLNIHSSFVSVSTSVPISNIDLVG